MNADKTRINADKIGIISVLVAKCAVQPTIDAKGELESPLRSGLKVLALRARPLRNLDRRAHFGAWNRALATQAEMIPILSESYPRSSASLDFC